MNFGSEKELMKMNKNNKLVRSISHYSKQIGGFAARHGNLIASCDGVGTKILLAQQAKRRYGRPLTSIGIDCVAMVINDLLCNGCEPLFFLDYFSSADIDEEDFKEVLDGMYFGCSKIGIELVGGETAELPGIIEKDTFDVCGFGVGISMGSLPKSNMQAGDIVIGLPSTGFHSNGYTTIRKHIEAVPNLNTEIPFAETEKDFIYSLLEPTKIYKEELDAIKEANIEIKGVAHITGGGHTNIKRILPKNLICNYRLYHSEQSGNKSNETRFFRHEKLFQWIQKEANLTKKQMMKTFNCGVGMIVIVPEDSEWQYLSNVLKEHLILGELEEK